MKHRNVIICPETTDAGCTTVSRLMLLYAVALNLVNEMHTYMYHLDMEVDMIVFVRVEWNCSLLTYILMWFLFRSSRFYSES